MGQKSKPSLDILVSDLVASQTASICESTSYVVVGRVLSIVHQRGNRCEASLTHKLLSKLPVPYSTYLRTVDGIVRTGTITLNTNSNAHIQ